MFKFLRNYFSKFFYRFFVGCSWRLRKGKMVLKNDLLSALTTFDLLPVVTNDVNDPNYQKSSTLVPTLLPPIKKTRIIVKLIHFSLRFRLRNPSDNATAGFV